MLPGLDATCLHLQLSPGRCEALRASAALRHQDLRPGSDLYDDRCALAERVFEILFTRTLLADADDEKQEEADDPADLLDGIGEELAQRLKAAVAAFLSGADEDEEHQDEEEERGAVRHAEAEACHAGPPDAPAIS